jgi:hypothetical protein
MDIAHEMGSQTDDFATTPELQIFQKVVVHVQPD